MENGIKTCATCAYFFVETCSQTIGCNKGRANFIWGVNTELGCKDFESKKVKGNGD